LQNLKFIYELIIIVDFDFYFVCEINALGDSVWSTSVVASPLFFLDIETKLASFLAIGVV